MTREEARSRAVGSFALAGFGAAFGVTGLAQTHFSSASGLLLLVAVCISVVAAATRLLRASPELPDPRLFAEERARRRRMWNAVNIIHWVAFATAIAILCLLHMPEYIAAATGIIVGLHMLPLATTFRYPALRITGAVLVLWSGACLALVPPSHVSGACAIGSGTALLLCAAGSLVGTLTAVRKATAQDVGP